MLTWIAGLHHRLGKNHPSCRFLILMPKNKFLERNNHTSPSTVTGVPLFFSLNLTISWGLGLWNSRQFRGSPSLNLLQTWLKGLVDAIDRHEPTKFPSLSRQNKNFVQLKCNFCFDTDMRLWINETAIGDYIFIPHSCWSCGPISDPYLQTIIFFSHYKYGD